MYIKYPMKFPLKTALLPNPLHIATYGVKNLDVQLGQTVIVFGTGTIGLMQMQLAKASGAGQVIMVGIEDYGLSASMSWARKR